ncbi:50S ribosomal protein L5 [Methanocella conradii]|uniref:50S ribosomal protein L5 n=1 Tax=Methanocella conradii TaxID=1175444 RepID=UPI00157D0415
MRTPRIEKVTVHMGVGESGKKLSNAEMIMQAITGQKPVRCFAKKTLPAFGIKKNEAIGCKVTLRGARAEKFLNTALAIKDKQLSVKSFDGNGNFAFGIEEHTDFPGMEYDPEVGIFGMDVIVSLERPGYRIKRRKAQRQDVPASHRLTVDDAISFLKAKYGVEVK